MIVKVKLGTMQNARKLVSIAESISYDVELCYDRYVVDAKSMLGVLSLPEFDNGELYIHTDNEKECDKILEQLLASDLLLDSCDAVRRSIYDITTFGEILIDFTAQNTNEEGQMLYARNPGGAFMQSDGQKIKGVSFLMIPIIVTLYGKMKQLPESI